MSVLHHDDGLEPDREFSFEKLFNTLHTAGVRPPSSGHLLVSPLGRPVEGDLNGTRRIRLEEIGQGGGDQRAIGEKGDEKSLLFGIEVNVPEVLPDEGFPSCKKKPETACLCDLIQDMANRLTVQFLFLLGRFFLLLRFGSTADRIPQDPFRRSVNPSSGRLHQVILLSREPASFFVWS
jgi:hypothetical protein